MESVWVARLLLRLSTVFGAGLKGHQKERQHLSCGQQTQTHTTHTHTHMLDHAGTQTKFHPEKGRPEDVNILVFQGPVKLISLIVKLGFSSFPCS